ncbi:hypothetical protein GS531_00845 [Rhodococcus hoagii]|nr:hypothetical protein [Prescottella equi]
MSGGTGPLGGIRVLDFTTTFSGPYCTQILAEMGADVIKVEAPGGDITRSLGTTRTPGMASVFVASNRNKSSIELDLKSDEARATIRALIRRPTAWCTTCAPRPPADSASGPTPLWRSIPG